VLADLFGLNGPRLREPDGFDAVTTDIAPSETVAAAAIRR
jgi:hypothetical protein